MTRQEAFHKYVDLNIWIRELSSPRLSDAVSAEEYGKLLVRSFTRIGDISRLSVDLIACADCLDASTDSVGRSYKQGKTIEAFIGELKSGSGTQYAPYLCDLFDDPALCEELNDILQSGRHNKYHQTYRVLEQ